MRLIDAEKISFKGIPMDMGGLVFIEDILLKIEELPTLDAVPVVRCKDCKYFQEETLLDDIRIASHCGIIDYAEVHGYRDGAISFDTTLLWRNEDDFCSRGERKEDD